MSRLLTLSERATVGACWALSALIGLAVAPVAIVLLAVVWTAMVIVVGVELVWNIACEGSVERGVKATDFPWRW